MRALSIRQPYAELILRGIKTAELRSRVTTIIGQRFYLYAAKAKSKPPVPIWSADLRAESPPAWMIELAEQVKLIEPGVILPTGVIVGSAVIEEVIPPDPSDGESGLFRWNLNHIKRRATPRATRSRCGLRHSKPCAIIPVARRGRRTYNEDIEVFG
jgi:hypothetical protein